MIKPNKIFIAADIFPPDIGGPATYAAGLARALLVRGYEVRVLCYGKNSFQKIQKWPFKVSCVNRRWPLPMRYFLYSIKLLFLSRGFSVVYAQGPIAAGVPAWLVKFVTGKRFYVKVVGDYAWEQARILKVTEQGIDEWQLNPKFLEFKYPGKIRLILRMQRRVVRAAEKVIVPAHYLKKVVSGWGVADNHIEVVYNAVSFPVVSEDLSKEEVKKKIGITGDVILGAGRFVPWKGFNFLIELMPEFLKINPNFKFVIAGEGQEMPSYQKLIRDLGLIEKVFLPGVLDKKQMLEYFKASDLFLLNSGYEGLPHAVLEAMKYHVPVVASNMGGNGEIVEDEINGLLVPYNDREAWLTAVRRLWTDKKLYARLTDTKMPELSCFNYDNMMESVIKVLVSSEI